MISWSSCGTCSGSFSGNYSLSLNSSGKFIGKLFTNSSGNAFRRFSLNGVSDFFFYAFLWDWTGVYSGIYPGILMETLSGISPTVALNSYFWNSSWSPVKNISKSFFKDYSSSSCRKTSGSSSGTFFRKFLQEFYVTFLQNFLTSSSEYFSANYSETFSRNSSKSFAGMSHNSFFFYFYFFYLWIVT